MRWIFLVLVCHFYVNHIDAEVELSKTLSISKMSGCISMAGAQSIFEEITRIFDDAGLSDAIAAYFNHNVSSDALAALSDCNWLFKGEYKYYSECLVGRALFAQNYIIEGNDNRQKQIRVAQAFEDIRKRLLKIYRYHEKMFYALDTDLKDSIMECSAQISYDIRSGNKGKTKWNAQNILAKLQSEALKATTVMSKMPEEIKSTLNNVFKKNKKINIASQFYSAVRNTDLEKDYNEKITAYSQISKKFSQVKVTKAQRNAVKLKMNAMMNGIEEAREYNTKSNETLERVEAVAEKVNSARSKSLSCQKKTQIGYDVLNELPGIIQSVDAFEVYQAYQYVIKINTYYRTTLKPLDVASDLGSVMDVIKDTIPEVYRSGAGELKEAYDLLSRFFQEASNNGAGTLYNDQWFSYLNRTERVMDNMLTYTKCLADVFQGLGRVVQNCMDGLGSLDEIYQRASSSFKNQDECFSLANIRMPPKDTLEKTIEDLSTLLGTFNADCATNTPTDGASRSFEDDLDNDDDEEQRVVLTPTQRFTVCNLRKTQKLTDEVIASKIKRPVELVQKVRCPNKKEREKLVKKIRDFSPRAG